MKTKLTPTTVLAAFSVSKSTHATKTGTSAPSLVEAIVHARELKKTRAIMRALLDSATSESWGYKAFDKDPLDLMYSKSGLEGLTEGFAISKMSSIKELEPSSPG